MFKRKIESKLMISFAISTLVFIALGVILLTIGMVAKGTLTNSTIFGTTTYKYSVAQLLKDWNENVVTIPGLNLESANLFDFYSNIEKVGLASGWDPIFYHQIANLLNTAIAGFSFFILSIVSAIATFVTGYLHGDLF